MLKPLPLGWIDESSPSGAGFRIMTEKGLKIFDVNEHEEYLEECSRVRELSLSLKKSS